jgi:hypothetical protein
MKAIYRVEYDEKWNTCKDWIYSRIDVLANDLDSAINKARKNSLKQTYVDDENKTINKCVGFRPREVKLLALADI